MAKDTSRPVLRAWTAQSGDDLPLCLRLDMVCASSFARNSTAPSSIPRQIGINGVQVPTSHGPAVVSVDHRRLFMRGSATLRYGPILSALSPSQCYRFGPARHSSRCQGPLQRSLEVLKKEHAA